MFSVSALIIGGGLSLLFTVFWLIRNRTRRHLRYEKRMVRYEKAFNGDKQHAGVQMGSGAVQLPGYFSDINSFQRTLRARALQQLELENDVRALPQLLQLLDNLKRSRWRFFFNHEIKNINSELESVKQLIAQKLDVQQQYIKAYPNIVCTECLTRTKMVQHQKIQYVCCRSCNRDDSLQTGVFNVVGVIGSIYKTQTEGTTLFVNLWNNQKHKAVYADVDELLLMNDVAIENYNWAVSAVVQTITNSTHQKKLKIPIVIQPGVELEKNSLMLLQSIASKLTFV